MCEMMNRVPLVYLLVLLVSGEGQSMCMILGCEHRSKMSPSCHSHGVCLLQFGQKHEHQQVILWLCAVMPFDSPVLSWCNGWSPGTSVTLLKRWWETQQSFLQQELWNCHHGRAGLPVQPEWAAGTIPCYQLWQGKLAKSKTREKPII